MRGRWIDSVERSREGRGEAVCKIHFTVENHLKGRQDRIRISRFYIAESPIIEVEEGDGSGEE